MHVGHTRNPFFFPSEEKTQQNLFHICLTQTILLRVVDYIHMCTRWLTSVGCADKCLWTRFPCVVFWELAAGVDTVGHRDTYFISFTHQVDSSI